MPNRPITLNNLSRALVEMGKNRSIRVCEDGLNIRLKIGDFVPVANSYNTLGLIMNDSMEPEKALIACARAYALLREVGTARNTGLTLLQLGEALRRLVSQVDRYAPDFEVLYHQAEQAIHQAREIFTQSSASGEPIRQAETYVELGCLYRDWMERTSHTANIEEFWQRRRENALHYLDKAIEIARDLDFLVRLELDALVNKGWTFYKAGQWQSVNEPLQKAKTLIQQHFSGAFLKRVPTGCG